MGDVFGVLCLCLVRGAKYSPMDSVKNTNFLLITTNLVFAQTIEWLEEANCENKRVNRAEKLRYGSECDTQNNYT